MSKRTQKEDRSVDVISNELSGLNMRDNSEENKLKINDLPIEILEEIFNKADPRSSLRLLATNKEMFQGGQFKKPKLTILITLSKVDLIKIDNTRNKKIDNYLTIDFYNNIITINDSYINKFHIKLDILQFNDIYKIYYVREYQRILVITADYFYFIRATPHWEKNEPKIARIDKIKRNQNILFLYFNSDYEPPMEIIPTKMLKYKNLTIATMKDKFKYIIGTDDKFYITNEEFYLVFSEVSKILNIENQTDAMIKLKEFYDKLYDMILKPFIDQKYRTMNIFYI
jgi:hypothetical protein